MDWNIINNPFFNRKLVLLSTRRVWIEITIISRIITSYNVTLHTESMDWNWHTTYPDISPSRYSPHGEYGLKYYYARIAIILLVLLSTRRVWIEIDNGILLLLPVPCYSPHGEYGLKLLAVVLSVLLSTVTLHTESMDWNYCRSECL